MEGPTEATEKLWDELQKLNDIQFERNGVYDMDTEIVSTITHDAGYLDKDLEKSSVYEQTNLETSIHAVRRNQYG